LVVEVEDNGRIVVASPSWEEIGVESVGGKGSGEGDERLWGGQ